MEISITKIIGTCRFNTIKHGNDVLCIRYFEHGIEREIHVCVKCAKASGIKLSRKFQFLPYKNINIEY